MRRQDVGFFDPKTEWSVVERALPHWSQPGVVTFVTWRVADSLPDSVLQRLDREIDSLNRGAGLDPTGEHLIRRAARQRLQLQRQLFAARDKYLDQGLGQCPLAQPELSEIVLDSLRRFDQQRYFLTDAVIMPNHVHFLCAFSSEQQMLGQCAAWKRFTARKLNQRTGRVGTFWQVDQFDHLVRDQDEYKYYRKYIAENPVKAGLRPQQYRHFQKKL